MKNAKKYTSIILAIVLLLSTFSCVSISAFAATSGEYEYTVLSDGTAEITKYNGKATNLSIPAKLGSYKVTSIGYAAFSHCSTIKTVTIPNSVKSIGADAFYDTAYYNEKSNWTNNVLYIGDYLIEADKAISGSYSIKNGTLAIAGDAFAECGSLKDVSIPNSVKEIGNGAFRSCYKLSSITIPNSVTTIGGNAFYDCGNLSNITIPDSVKSIGYGAFVFCESLTSITLPNSLTSIERGMFGFCENLTNITIPKSVIKIDENVFGFCGKLKNVYYTGDKAQWKKISVLTGNDALNNATVHYNYIPQLATPKLSSVANTETGIKVTWGKVSGAAKYRVFYKANGEKTWHKAGDTTSTSFTWTKAKSNTKYTFTVRCIDKDGKNYTSSYNSTGKSIKYIAAPKLSSVSNTATGVKISWGKVAGAAKYRVFYKANGEKTWHKAGDTASTSYTWTKAKSGTKYTFTVRCIDKNGNYTSSYNSTGKSIKYIAAPKIKTLSKTSSGVKISWNKVSGAEKYRIFYKTGNGSWKKLTDTTSTSYTWKGGKKGTTYTFTVRCVDKNGKTYTSSYDSKGKSIKR